MLDIGQWMICWVFVFVFVYHTILKWEYYQSGARGSTHLIWCWISVNGWYVGYRVTDDVHYLSKGMEPLSPSISQGVGKALPTLQEGELFKLNIFSISHKVWVKNVGHRLSADVLKIFLKYFKSMSKTIAKIFLNCVVKFWKYFPRIFLRFIWNNLKVF